jgi:putative hydrolase of the HAD superfamily
MTGKKIEAVVFDLDNTLFDESTYFNAVLTFFLSVIGRNDIGINNLVDISERFRKADYLGFLLKKMFLYNENMQEKLFECYCNLNHQISLKQNVIDTLKALKSSSFRLGIVTNGVVSAQKSKINCLSLSSFVDDITYAREFGVEFEKPHARPFLDICKKLDCDPVNVLFVGDHPINDIRGACNIGMQTCWLANPYFINPKEADFVIENIYQLFSKIINEN